MKAKFKIGDEVIIKNGVKVYSHIPEKYVYSNRPFSEELTQHYIEIGKVYSTEQISKRDIKGEANHISNVIWKTFLSYHYELDFNICKKFVEEHIDVNKALKLTKFCIKEGKFIVKRVTYYPAVPIYERDPYPEYYSYCLERINSSKTIDIIEIDEYSIDKKA